MENSPGWEQKTLINELARGKELAKQLQNNLTSSSHETCELLIHNILNSYDKALSMLKWNGSVAGEPELTGAAMGITSESPSLCGSPHSEDSDRDFKDHEHKDGSRKRKSTPRWTQQVQVCPGTGLEGPLDDGYSWRKYGQKDILGAKYPRGYYRCTHRNVQGCLATKQVQRSDEDPTIFEITYRGRHTCTPQPPPPPPPPEKQEQPPNTTLDNPPPPPPQQQQQSLETPLNFQTGLKVITEDLETPNNNQTFPFFYFPSTSQENCNAHLHSPSMGNFSDPSFISPATSGTSYFSLSPSPTGTGMAGFGRNQSLDGSDQSELAKIVAAAAATSSAATSPTAGLDFPFGSMDQFEPSFSFDNNPGFIN
ncbi:hypothetical protein HYC85_013520 [Camellia sinensis]|uniref:WRKY domain-containing protein n=1 Tax=Camellia sinensis TaxID=4442 RepID=A0A7J7H3K4_CAMSI|nr:hypothetical protein HYC85_013520 [Camellia sinensis]